MLELRDVHTHLAGSHILQGVSIAVGKREIVCILGKNGAGKTTTISTIMGLWQPSGGEIRFKGASLVGLEPYRIARRGIGLVPQGRRIFPSLSVEENLTLPARPGTKGLWSLGKVLKIFPVLRERAAVRGGLLSGGEQQMLAIGRALMTNPDLILMDEPSEGLAPIVLNEVAWTVRRLRDFGLSILLVEQNLQLALEISDRAYVIDRGRIVFEGASKALQDDPKAKAAFLGV